MKFEDKNFEEEFTKWLDSKSEKEIIDSLKEFTKENKELKNKVKQLGKGQHSLMLSRRKWKRRYYKEKKKELDLTTIYIKGFLDGKEYIKDYLDAVDYEQQNIVRRYEEMRRTTKSDYYKKSYQTTIHKANAKRELIKELIKIIMKEGK